ncbi:MAG: glycosyltransferase family 4 protein [Herminiimonas sp.]|nr:glycosyltransferase family 4 protein [Herminiimonas sp.]
MRVGLSTTTIEPALTHGRLDGIGVYTSAMLKALPQAGCTVQGYSFAPAGGSVKAAALSAGTPMPRSFALASLADLVVPFSKTRLPVDVYHATDYRIVRMACPVVATLHDAITLKHPEWCRPKLRALKNWAQKCATAKADRIIALSHFAVAELVEYFDVDPQRISVVACGVDAEWMTPPPVSAVDRTLRSNGLERGYFLFVGTLQPRKNIDRIIDAYRALPPAVRRARQLVLVGSVGWRCDDLISKIRGLIQNGETIVWLSQLVDHEQLRHVYAGAGVFVFPSLYEGFGIPVTEAFASGIPVLTSNTTSLPEVSQGAALEIDPLSVADISLAMQSLAQDDLLRARCVAAGRRRAAQLTWQSTAEQTVAVYRAALG